MGGDQLAAVDHSGGGGDHLDGGDADGLAEAAAGQVYQSHVLLFVVEALGLVGQIDAGGAGETVGIEIAGKLLHTQLQSQLDGTHVTAVFQDVRHRFHSVAGTLEAGVVLAQHIVGAVTEHRGIAGDDAGIQSRRGGDGFEYAAGVVQFADGLVAPQNAAGVAQSLLPLLLVLDGHNGVVLVGIQDHIGLVGVKVGLGSHGQNSAGVHVHHNGGDTVFGIVLLHRRHEILFHNGLDIGVDGEHHIIAVLGGIDHRAVCGHFPVQTGAGRDAPAFHAGQLFVVGNLHAGDGAVAAAVHKAQHAGHEIAVGIFPPGGAGKGDSLAQAVVLADLFHLVVHRLVHPPGQYLVGAVVVAELFKQLLLVHPKNGRQLGGQLGSQLVLLHVFVPGADHIGAGLHIPHHRTAGQDPALGVQDAAPQGFQHGVFYLLGIGGGFQLVAPDDLQLVQLGHQGAETHPQHQHPQKNHPGPDAVRFAFPRTARFFGLPLHLVSFPWGLSGPKTKARPPHIPVRDGTTAL